MRVFLLLSWDLLERQNCRCSFDVGDIATKVKSLFDLESSTFDDQILTLQNDIQIKSRSTSAQPGKHAVHWKILVAGKYHNLIRCTLNLTALYGSTCVVLAFSHVKSIKSKYRTTTDNHLVACLRLATSCYTPDCEKLAPSSQWQVPTVYGGNFIFSNPEIHLFCIWFIFLFGSYQGHCLSTGWWVYERVRV